MKICMYGAGAVGGHIAGRLAEAGASVSIVERGENVAVLRERGLRVETKNGALHSHPVVTDDSKTLEPQDVVIVALKAPFLPQATHGLIPILKPSSLVVFIGNGIPWWYFQSHGGPLDGKRLEQLDPGGKLWDALGSGKVVGAVAYTASTVIAPGVVEATNARNRIILGRPDGRLDSRLDALAAFMVAGGLEVEVTERIRNAVWQKLVSNLVGGSIGLLTASTTGQALSSSAIEAAASSAAQEVADVAASLGCDAGDVGAAVVRLKASTHTQSISQDLEAGRVMEIDALLLAPLELARMAGVPTPTLDLIVALAVQRSRAAGLYTAISPA
jgi:2-dehydropantoate 2-reductase